MTNEATSPTKVTVIDAGIGNLGNLTRALRHLGAEVEVTSDAAVVAASRCVVLPGVGAFRPPRERLRGGLEAAIRQVVERDDGWLLGICVGYQLLFESSDEFGETDGLGLLPGRISRLPEGVAIPHIGWNALRAPAAKGWEHPLLGGVTEGDHVYFVHSYAVVRNGGEAPSEVTLAECRHGAAFTAVAGHGRVLGTQFHPEKSGRVGLRLLANYLRLASSTPTSATEESVACK